MGCQPQSSKQISTEDAKTFRAHSSFAREIWRGSNAPAGYEWWYFDAISDDGRDVLVIIFLANFIFSPRYNRAAAEDQRKTNITDDARFPAVAVWLYRDGRPLLRAVREYERDEFEADTRTAHARIGRNEFRFRRTSDGSPYYDLNLDLPLRRRERLEAFFSWKVIDGDLLTQPQISTDNPAHEWNAVAPRCQVWGSFYVTPARGGRRTFDFRGTGYHDHNRDTRWLPATVDFWQWGRAHFDDATAIFYRYRERSDEEPLTRLFLIRNDSLSQHEARLEAVNRRTHFFGLSYPREMKFETTDGSPYIFRIRQRRAIESSFFYLRFIADASLETGDGRTRHALAITEHLAPRALSRRWLHHLIDMRIGRGERGSFLS